MDNQFFFWGKKAVCNLFIHLAEWNNLINKNNNLQVILLSGKLCFSSVQNMHTHTHKRMNKKMDGWTTTNNNRYMISIVALIYSFTIQWCSEHYNVNKSNEIKRMHLTRKSYSTHIHKTTWMRFIVFGRAKQKTTNHGTDEIVKALYRAPLNSRPIII